MQNRLPFLSIQLRVAWIGVLSAWSLIVQPGLAQSTITAQPLFRVKSDATTGASGLAPATVKTVYGFSSITNLGAGQTIAIVDAYDDANIEADLGKFDTNFSLTACTTANGCFKKIYATGTQPAANATWSLEIALDVEWAHALAPSAKIILVEAASASITDLLTAVSVAVKNGASVVSMSFGGNEASTETSYDTDFTATQVTFVAAAGDNGSGVQYPAASPNVVSVGGTTLTVTSGAYGSETAWIGSSGGISAYELEPAYQKAYPITNDTKGYRGVPDVAYNANATGGFSVYDSITYNGTSGWFVVGGTSAGTAQWAAIFAIANSSRVAAKKLPLSTTTTTLYATAASASYATNFHDVKSGTNGTCGTLCTAAASYDYVTGLGSPQVKNLIPALVAQP